MVKRPPGKAAGAISRSAAGRNYVRITWLCEMYWSQIGRIRL